MTFSQQIALVTSTTRLCLVSGMHGAPKSMTVGLAQQQLLGSGFHLLHVTTLSAARLYKKTIDAPVYTQKCMT